VISQANKQLLLGLGLAAYWQTSALTSVFATTLLTSTELPGLLKLNSERLTNSYRYLTEAFTRWGTEFIPANAGLFVYAKLVESVTSWEKEAALVKSLEDSGVIVSPGKKFDGPKEARGWVRITFAVPLKVLEEAVRRIEGCLKNFQGDL
jgi:aspartate/methionine/tyrosine aminotransferase